MNNEMIIAIVVAVAIVATVLAAAKYPKIRHAFLVPEGYAGLLYHKGKFVKTLGAGRHIRWGRHFTFDAQDLRLIQSLTAAQNAGNTVVLGVPGGFVPLKNGKASWPAPNTEEGGAT